MKVVILVIVTILFVLCFQVFREDGGSSFISIDKQIEKAFPVPNIPFPEPQKRKGQEEQVMALVATLAIKKPKEKEEDPFKKIIEEGNIYQKRKR